jgi:hypothetical protein
MRRTVLLFASSIALMLLLVDGCRADNFSAATFRLQFRGGDVAGNFARVISALSDHGLLQFYPFLVDGQKTPAEMLRDSGKFPPDLVTSDVERVLCRLNTLAATSARCCHLAH